MVLKAIIFDFDGVILESMDIKTNAFRELFKDFPEHLDAILDYHLMHGGMSRYKKFKYIYKRILGKQLDDKKLEELGDKFSQLVVEKVMECPFIPGAIDFLEEHSKNLKLYVASGTPEEELRMIIKRRGLLKYFEGIYGTPKLKSEIIDKISSANGYRKNEVLFIGDSITDYEGAKKAGVPFIGFAGDSSSNPFAGLKTPFVRGFGELRKLLEELYFSEIPAFFIPK